jgi:prophage regulatory protein
MYSTKLSKSAPQTHGATITPFDSAVAVTLAQPPKLLRLPAVMGLCALGRSSVYAGVKAGTFPSPVSLGARAVAWRESEIFQWCADRTKSGKAVTK